VTPPRSAGGGIAVITGASSGIGQALAQRFAAAGFDLWLVARSAPALQAQARTLEAAHGIRAKAVPADLAQPGAARQLATAARCARRRVDVLVNCAGVLEFGAFAEMPAARSRAMVDLNVGGLTEMLAHFVPGMVARGSGRVLNVASIAAFQPVPMLATYAATKAYVLSITESLAEELRGSGVSVTALCPGITATPMLRRAERARRELQQLPDFLVGSVDLVADEGFAACMAGDVICVPGALNQAAILAGRSTPKWLLRRIGGAFARGLGR
jgi:short-subunit dehydrogenase